MRKVASISITFIFLISFIGIQVNKHYLKGELYSSAVFNEAKHCCDDTNICGLDNKLLNTIANQNDCSCENETEVLIISSEFIGKKHAKLEIITLEFLSVDLFETIKLSSSISILKILVNRMAYSFVVQNFQAVSGVFLC